jgi:hypothetical protein
MTTATDLTPITKIPGAAINRAQCRWPESEQKAAFDLLNRLGRATGWLAPDAACGFSPQRPADACRTLADLGAGVLLAALSEVERLNPGWRLPRQPGVAIHAALDSYVGRAVRRWEREQGRCS